MFMEIYNDVFNLELQLDDIKKSLEHVESALKLSEQSSPNYLHLQKAVGHLKQVKSSLETKLERLYQINDDILNQNDNALTK